MLIRHANGIEVAGEVLAIDPPRRIVFTYGYRQWRVDPGWRFARDHRAAAGRRAARGFG